MAEKQDAGRSGNGDARAGRTFRPGLASTLVTILLFPCLIGLGLWQLDRGAQKKALHAEYVARHDAPALSSLGGRDPAVLTGQAVRLNGHWGELQFLLENRPRDGKTGYEVLTPWLLEDGGRILVNRGWLPAGPDRSMPPRPPLPASDTVLEGRLGRLPYTGMRLGQGVPPERIAEGLFRLQQLSPGPLEKLTGGRLPLSLVYLDPGAPNGYDRRWPEPSADVSKHRAYALQWFAMAAVLVLLYLKVNLSSGERHDGR